MLTKLVKYSSILFAGNTISGLVGLLFTSTMARLLGPAKFGDLIAIFSLTIIVSIPIDIITNIITRFVAKYNVQNNSLFITALINKASRISFVSGIILVGIFYLFIPTIASFLSITEFKLFYIIGLSFPLFLVSAVASGVLYGTHKFSQVIISGIVGSLIKLALAVILIGVGLSTSGAVIASIAASYIAYIYILRQIKKHLKLIKDKASIKTINHSQIKKEILSYSGTIAIVTLLLAITTNADILLTKHYFNTITAGHYAALSTLGKLIFYLASPILVVMFPLISSSSKQEKARSITNSSLTVLTIIAIITLVTFILIPQFVVKTLFSTSYLPITPYLLPLAIAFVFYAFARGLVYHFLALNQKQFMLPLALAVIAQIALIAHYHANITEVVYILLGTNLFMFVSLGIIYKLKIAK